MKRICLLMLLSLAVLTASAQLGSLYSTASVEIGARVLSAKCPISLGEGHTITSVDTEGHNLVFTYVIDERYDDTTLYYLRNSKSYRAEVKDELRDMLLHSDSDTRDLVKRVKKASYSIVYRFVGSYSNSKVNIVIYPNEL